MTESRVSDKSGNGRFATMDNKGIIGEDGRCQKGIALNSRALHINERLTPNETPNETSNANLQLTVAAWIFLKKVKVIVYTE